MIANYVFPPTNEAKMSPSSKEHMGHLLKLLNSSSSSSTSRLSFAKIGTKPNALSCYSKFSLWIIDSSASNKMTNFFHLFITYLHCSSNEKFRIDDAIFSPIARKD